MSSTRKSTRSSFAPMPRRNALLGAAALIAGAAMGSAVQAQELTPFRVGVSAPVVSVLPVYLAEAGKFYEKQGLKTEIISSEGGTRGIQVLLSGEIQVMHVGLSPVVAANTEGADLRAIASTTNTLPITVFSTKRQDPPLPKGTSIGISTIGSETDIALNLALKALGVKREDMNISQIGGTSQRYAAMQAGRIEVAPLLEPAITAAKQKGMHVVYDLSAAKTPWIFDAVVVSNNYLKQNGPTVDRFLKAYIEGAYWGMAEEAKAKEVISQRFKTKDQTVIDATYEGFKSLMPRDGKPSVEGAKLIIEHMRAGDVKNASTKVEDYVDLTPIERLEKSGFFAEMQQRYGVK